MEERLPSLSDDNRDDVKRYTSTMLSKDGIVFEITVTAVTMEEADNKLKRIVDKDTIALDVEVQ
jgi:hypothetical protein